MNKLAVYIHWPFCLSKCPYCDFNSRPLPQGEDEAAWAEAYARELAFYAARTAGRPVSSIYFGGGTPSLMQPQTVASVLEKIAALWPITSDCEITLEANPSSSEMEKFKAFRAAGVNRLSLGVQALDDAALRFLGRAHDAASARRAMEAAARTFERFSFDFIYARAGQTLEAWEKEVREALSFAPRHLSLYQLTIEPGTVFAKRSQSETLQTDEDLSVSLFEQTQELMESAGLPAYEISNHAMPGQESRHNLCYWHYDDYLGIGPGAHGRFVDEGSLRRATANERKPEVWMRQGRETGRGCAEEETLNAQQAQHEALLMGLRLRQGIDRAAWREKFGDDILPFVSAERVATLQSEGLIDVTAMTFRATSKGREKLNAVLAYL